MIRVYNTSDIEFAFQNIRNNMFWTLMSNYYCAVYNKFAYTLFSVIEATSIWCAGGYARGRSVTDRGR